METTHFVDLMKVVVFAGVSFLDMYTSTTLTMLQDTRRLCLQLPELFGTPPHATFEQIRTTLDRFLLC